MMQLGGRSLAVLLLLFSVLCATIGLEVAGQWQAQPINAPVRIDPPKPRPVASPTDQSNRHDEWFSAIVARPLFSPDRRPVAPDARTVRGLPRLSGIVVSGSRRVAIFAAPSGGNPVVVEAGSRMGAYDVREITETGVMVVGPQGATTIRPIFDAAAPVSPKAPVQARPALPKAVAK